MTTELSVNNPSSDYPYVGQCRDVYERPKKEARDGVQSEQNRMIASFTKFFNGMPVSTEHPLFIKDPQLAADICISAIKTVTDKHVVNKIIRQFQIYQLSKLATIEETVVLKGSDGQLCCNKELLMRSSDYFATIFSPLWREPSLTNGLQTIEFPDHNLASLTKLKEGIYDGVWNEIASKEAHQSIHSMIECMQLAHMIDMAEWYYDCKTKLTSLLADYKISSLIEFKNLVKYISILKLYNEPELISSFLRVIIRSQYCPYKLKQIGTVLLVSSDQLTLVEESRKILNSKEPEFFDVNSEDSIAPEKSVSERTVDSMQDFFTSQEQNLQFDEELLKLMSSCYISEPEPQFDEEIQQILLKLIKGCYIDSERELGAISNTFSAISDDERDRIQFIKIDTQFVFNEITPLLDPLFAYCPNLKGLSIPFPGRLINECDSEGKVITIHCRDETLSKNNLTTFVAFYKSSNFNLFGKPAVLCYEYEDTYYVELLSRLKNEPQFECLQISPPPDDDCFVHVKLSPASKELNQDHSKIKLTFELNLDPSNYLDEHDCKLIGLFD